MVSLLKYNEDIYDFLPLEDEQKKAMNLYQNISGGRRIVAMIKMKDDSEVDIDRMSEVVDSFTNNIKSGEGCKHVKEIISQVDFAEIEKITGFIYRNIPIMLADSDYVRMEAVLSNSNSIKEHLAEDAQKLMLPSSGYYNDLIEYDPIGLFTPVFQRMRTYQTSIPYEIDNGYIFTPNKKYALVFITSAYGSMESANNALLVDYINNICQHIEFANPDIDISIVGSPVIAVDNANQIKDDSKLAIGIATVLIISLLLFSFRNYKSLVLIACSVIFGWLFTMAFIAVIRDNVSLIVLGIGSIIIGIAVNYPLHFIAHSLHVKNMHEVLKDMTPPLLIGNITTVGAFACLIPLDAPALRDLGMFAAVMLIGTILFVLVFLPHFIVRNNEKHKEYILFGRISNVTIKSNRWTILFIIVLTIIFGYYSFDTSFDTNINNVNFITSTQEKLMSDLQVSSGVKDTANIYIVVEGETWDNALSSREIINHKLDSLKNSLEIESYSNVTNFVCSKEEQLNRIKKWNAFWERHRDQVLEQIKNYAPQYGFAPDAFDEFEEIIRRQYGKMEFESFEVLTSAILSNSLCINMNNYSVVDIVHLKNSNTKDVKKELSCIIGNNGFVFDFTGMNSSIANSLTKNFNYIGIVCGFIVFLFLWLSFGRLELSVLAFIPMTLGWIWILGIMQIIGIQFNIVNIILATFIFGQGDDYTIFITDGLINEHAYGRKLLPSYKNSIIISSLIMFFGMGALIVAKHPALHSLAEVTIIGMIAVVLMAWIVPPVIFTWLVKSGSTMRRTPVTIEQIIRITYCTLVYLFEVLYGSIFGYVIKLFSSKHNHYNDWFHRMIHRTMIVNMTHIWGVKAIIHNETKEDFQKGGIIICNHESILDSLYLLSVSPRILFVVNEKVWNNPIVHHLFKLAGYINVNQPIENLTAEISKAVDKNYLVVIFPEGKRNKEKITRFHRGAFQIAQDIKTDILPIYLHGAGHVMPKGSAFAERGQVDVFIGKRVSSDKLKEYGSNPQDVAYSFYHSYQKRFHSIRKQIETTHYYHPYVFGKYVYKGIQVEKETRRLLKQYDDFSRWIDGIDITGRVSILNAGQGQFSLMFALVHPEVEVYSYTNSQEDAALAKSCKPLPSNLHVICESVPNVGSSETVIDLSNVYNTNKYSH